ncbi:MAG: helicase-exonuclease AddAB subunit AddB [Lachnospiraceae bacterium]|nr:helicase-exonuclease AddAB subunit AddB [Lachnospiraceae bacterium]
MGLQFWFGASGSGKSHLLYQHIIMQAKEQEDRNFLVIVPDQFTMQTQWDLVAQSQSKGIFNIDVLSFGRLTKRIFDEVGGENLPVLDDTGKSLVLRKVAADVENKLPVLGRNLHKIGYIHEVKSAISEFMQYGISVSRLESVMEESAARGALQAKLKDLSVLYAHFLDYINESFITTEETLGRLCRLLPQSRLVKDAVVCFDGFTGFTPIQNEVILTMTGLAKQVIVSLDMEEEEDPHQLSGEQKLFYLSVRTVNQLERLLDGQELPKLPDVWIRRKEGRVARFADNPELAHLERYLFRFPGREYEAAPERISLFQASTPREEVRQTCIKIAKLIREEGYSYRDIAVIMGDTQTYAGSVKELFTRFGFPFFLDQTRGILLNPFIELIRSALRMQERDFSYEAVFHYLRSGLTGFSSEEIDLFENYVLAHDIRGRKRYEHLFVYRGEETEESLAYLEQMNALRERLMEQLEPLLVPCETVGDYARALYHFLEAGEVQQKLADYEALFEGQGDTERAKEYGQIYRLVMDLLDQIVGLLGEEKMDREQFYEILDAGFGEIQVGTIPQNVDRIVVGDMERTRLKQIRALFFLGINDGNIPRAAKSGGLLSDIDREFLEEQNPDMELAPTPRKQMYIQRLYLYMNMTKPTDRLFLSYAVVGADGKSLRPAYLVASMQKLFPKLRVEFPEKMALKDQLMCEEDGYDMLAADLRDYCVGISSDEVKLLIRLYGTGGNRIYDCLEQAAFRVYRDSKLSNKTARLLYGSLLQNSVSRLERFAACEYAHFLQYGLQLSEREQYDFEASDLGTIFHGILEIFGRKIREHGSSWLTFTQEQAGEWIREAIEEFATQYGDTILYSSARRQYVLTRMERVMNRTVSTLKNQLVKGVFEPEKFEMSFSKVEDLAKVDVSLTQDEKMKLIGRIDRVDVFEDASHVYVKILDYKSGKKQLDLAAVYYGLQLQLVVYLNAAMEDQKSRHPDKEIVPAGILYYRMADPLVEECGEDEEHIRAQIQEQLRAVGLVNEEEDVLRLMDKESTGRSDVIPVEWKKDGTLSSRSQTLSRERLEALSDYVDRKITGIGAQILRGQISLNPYEMGAQSACTYCEYKNVCGFDRQIPGMDMRRLDELTDDEIFERISEEREGES